MRPEVVGPGRRPDRDAVIWDDFRLMLAVARTRDVVAAAAALGVTPPTVRTRLAALEARHGGALFRGPSRGLAPQPLALPLLAVAEAMEAEVARFVDLAEVEHSEPRGLVRVCAPELIGQFVVVAALGDLKARWPDITVELVLVPGGRAMDLSRADIAFLPNPPDDTDFVRTEIRDVGWGLYAQRAYLDRAGRPKAFADVVHFDLIGVETPNSTFSVFGDLGVPHDSPRFRFRSDSFTMQLAALRAGLGIGQCQTGLARRFPELERVAPTFSPRLPGYLVMREWLIGVARVQLVHDALREALEHYVAES